MTTTCQASCTSPASAASPVKTSGTVKSFIAGAVYTQTSAREIKSLTERLQTTTASRPRRGSLVVGLVGFVAYLARHLANKGALSLANSQCVANVPEQTGSAAIRPSPSVARSPGRRHAAAFERSTPSQLDLLHSRHTDASCRSWRLIQSTTVGLPSVLAEIRPCAAGARARFRRTSLHPPMRSMTVVITLKIEELHFQICSRPEEHAVETFAPNRADQPFDKWMRQRHVGHRLDSRDVEDP